MENSRPYTDNFKQHAFKWKAEFGQRHERVYSSPQEADRYVERQGATTKVDIIDAFVSTQCHRDVERYLYRSRLLEGFLQLGNLERIQEPHATGTSTAQVLIDDRNDASATRDSTGGNFRRPAGPLDSRSLYNELLRAVRIPTNSYFSLLTSSSESGYQTIQMQSAAQCKFRFPCNPQN
jgi:hypothetical protein